MGEGNNLHWKLTCFYGHPVVSSRADSWALLHHLKSFSPDPWVCVGDFNEIVEQSEKEGAALRGESQMEGFRAVLEMCELSDLGFVGPKFTWNNGRSDELFTKERLDRAVANPAWCNYFQEVLVLILAAHTSNHNLVLVSFSTHPIVRSNYHRSFKFEDSWTSDSEWLDVLKSAWLNDGVAGQTLESVQFKLSSCQLAFSRWSKKKFGNSSVRLLQLTRQLLHLQSVKSPNHANAAKLIQKEIEGILEGEDVRWKQRAKQNWYRGGDCNT